MDIDGEYMQLALEEARKAKDRGDLPIGAVLIINNEIIGRNASRQYSNNDYYSHAESILIGEYAVDIKKAHKNSEIIKLYSTLEPCFMCFGTAVHNRINEIIYACPDPIAGVSGMNPPKEWYRKRWPVVREGVFKEDAFQLFFDYIIKRPEEWKSCISSFEEMRKNW